ncbi:MAG: hypothetical protein JXB05_06625 [Myxococcaceae bacterium]|nr:hypothetical protein [Myxococcaceae bacterium]
MDIEFHHYICHLIAAKAGFGAEEARTIAYASQYVDDNTKVYTIDEGSPAEYQNYISQTVNILKRPAELLRIYPLFHFPPGDPIVESARRKDGAMHRLNTTPDSPHARWILDEALKLGDLFRIGVAAHTYADSWAHQNFVGFFSSFNKMQGTLDRLIPDIGHADAEHQPDRVGLVWEDSRLSNSQVDNTQRFLEAARTMFLRFARYVDKAISDKALAQKADELVRDLTLCIGGPDPKHELSRERINRYREFASSKEYGGRMLAVYDKEAWFQSAVDDHKRWKEPQAYQQTDWYRFQEAVKSHQQEFREYLEERAFKGMELPAF